MEEKIEEIVQKNDWFATSRTLAGIMAGIGLLGVPVAVSQAGWVGVFLLGLYGFISYYTTHKYLAEVCLKTIIDYDNETWEIFDYPTLGFLTWGSKCRSFFLLSQSFSLFGTAVIYFVIAGKLFSLNFPLASAGVFTVMTTLLTCITMSLVRNFAETKIISLMAIATTIFSANNFVAIISLIRPTAQVCPQAQGSKILNSANSQNTRKTHASWHKKAAKGDPIGLFRRRGYYRRTHCGVG